MISLLPIRAQAWFWAHWMELRRGHTSHWRIEAIRELRRTSKIPLKDAKTMIDAVIRPSQKK